MKSDFNKEEGGLWQGFIIVIISLVVAFCIGRYVFPITPTKEIYKSEKVLIKESDEKKCVKAGGEVRIYKGVMYSDWECKSKVINLDTKE